MWFRFHLPRSCRRGLLHPRKDTGPSPVPEAGLQSSPGGRSNLNPFINGSYPVVEKKLAPRTIAVGRLVATTKIAGFMLRVFPHLKMDGVLLRL